MKWFYHLYMLLGVCLFSMAGCSGALPYVIRRSGATEPFPSYTVTQRDIACVAIVTFDPKAAAERYPPEQPILWTFGINFDELSSTGNPLGCLRLYRREHEPEETFVEIDVGGILVDTCEMVDNGSPVFVMKSAVGGEAIFTGGGYIQCEMNLGIWVKKLADDWPFPAAIEQELITFSQQPIHLYTNFTMAATLSAADPVGSKPARPILNYSPVNGAAIDFSLTIANQSVTAAVDLCEYGAPPGYPLNKMGVWWYDVQDNKKRPLYLRYYMTDGTPAVRMLCNVLPEATPTPPSAPIQFSIGPATLYIGYDPTESSLFFGSIDGVLIDPSDSKPTE
jgi:hypothetical protein